MVHKQGMHTVVLKVQHCSSCIRQVAGAIVMSRGNPLECGELVHEQVRMMSKIA